MSEGETNADHLDGKTTQVEYIRLSQMLMSSPGLLFSIREQIFIIRIKRDTQAITSVTSDGTRRQRRRRKGRKRRRRKTKRITKDYKGI